MTGLDWGAVVAVARRTQPPPVCGPYHTIGSAWVPWGEDYDLVLLPNFLHHFDRAACTGLLRRARAVDTGRPSRDCRVDSEWDRVLPAPALSQ